MNVDWQEILVEFSGSGITAKQFCKERSINKATFYSPIAIGRKKKLSSNKETPKGFLEIDVSAPSKANIEIEYPNGVKLRVLSTLSKTELRGLIYV